MILVIFGPSGAGKTTLHVKLRDKIPDARLLISVTTRPPRDSDAKGEYDYVSERKFSLMREAGEFLWDIPIGRYLYGTRKADIDQALECGMRVATLVPEKVRQLREYCELIGKSSMLRSICLHTDDLSVLERRLRGRGDSEEEIRERMRLNQKWNREIILDSGGARMISAIQPSEAILKQALEYLRIHDSLPSSY